MDVIRHDYVPTHRDIELEAGSSRVLDEGIVRDIERMNADSVNRAERNEKYWRFVGIKDLLEPRGTPFDHAGSVAAAVSGV